MFGALRLLLAYLVVISHLAGSAYAEHFGFYAVRGFFVLSGYIMTSALNEVYAFDGARFWLNRLLRLLPGYYLVVLLTLTAIALVPNAAQFQPTWQINAQHHDFLMNFLVLPLQFNELNFRLLPPYWSIAVEIEMYLLLWIVLGRSQAFATIGLIAGLAYHLACMYDGLHWEMRYYAAPSALLSFSLGALVYFVRKKNPRVVTAKGATLAGVLWLVNLLAAGSVLSPSYVYGAGFYLGIVLFMILVAGLANVNGSPAIAKFDHQLGELAYPVFLLQWLAGLLVFETIMPGMPRGWLLLLAATPGLLLGAAILAWTQRRYVEPIRRLLRPESTVALRPARTVVIQPSGADERYAA